MGFDDLSQRKGPADNWLEVSAGQMVEYVLLGLLRLFREFIRIRHDLEQCISLDGEVLGESDEEWVWGRIVGHDAVLENNPPGGGRYRQCLKAPTSDRIEDDPRAPTAGDRVDTFGQILVVGNNHMISAEGEELLLLPGSPRRSNAGGALDSRDLDRRDTDAAARCRDDDEVASSTCLHK